MKKVTMILCAVFVSSLMMAQDGLVSKRGINILPEAGEWAIGIDASPIFEYVGNIFNGTMDNSAPVFQSNSEYQGVPGGFAICGKMMVDANTAYRARVRVGLNNTSDRTLVPDATDAGEFVEDESKTSNFGIALGAGIEKRRGSSRVQGVYGAEAMIGFGSSSTEELYGNDIEDEFPLGGSRPVSSKSGSTVMFGVNGFAGIEYFVAPKVSIGGEYTWGLSIMSTGDDEFVTETYDGTNDDTITSDSAGGSSFSLDTGTRGQFAMKANFYF